MRRQRPWLSCLLCVLLLWQWAGGFVHCGAFAGTLGPICSTHGATDGPSPLHKPGAVCPVCQGLCQGLAHVSLPPLPHFPAPPPAVYAARLTWPVPPPSVPAVSDAHRARAPPPLV